MLNESTLADGLATLEPTTSLPTAIQRIADAYATYATDAASLITSVPITPAGVELGKTAMTAALQQLAVPTPNVPIVLTAACVAFWGAVAASFAVSFPASVALVPPAFAGLTALLITDFKTNQDEKKELRPAAAAVAKSIHAQTIAGGTVSFMPVPPAVIVEGIA